VLRFTPIVALVLLALVAGASAAPPPERVIARKTTTGDFADATATGSVRRPALVRIRLAATPAQPVQVTWSLRCTKGKRAATRSGQFRATAPHERRVLFPLAKPDRCTATATAQLEQQGSLTVSLLAR
jgi:hypothetical protein